MKKLSLLIALFALALTASASTPQIPYLGSGTLTFGADGQIGDVTVTDPNGIELPRELEVPGDGRILFHFSLEPDTVYSFTWTWPAGQYNGQTAAIVAQNDIGSSSDSRGWVADNPMPANMVGIQCSCSYHLDPVLPWQAHITLWNVAPLYIAEPPPLDIAVQSATSGN